MNLLEGYPVSLKYLVDKYGTLEPCERIRELFRDFLKDDVLVTSSMGTSSVLLLHMLSRVAPQHKVYFIDTTFLFKETHDYKEAVRNMLNLDLVTIRPEKWKNEFTVSDRTWEKDPDLCCSVNKVEPLERVKKDHKIWMSGLMAFQTKFRSSLDVFEKNGSVVKFHPLIDVSPEFVEGYFERYRLPRHPLEKSGYSSVGCTHCTVKGQSRNGRWVNFTKTECGLHYEADKE